MPSHAGVYATSGMPPASLSLLETSLALLGAGELDDDAAAARETEADSSAARETSATM